MVSWKEMDKFFRGVKRTVISLEEMENLLEGACKMKWSKVRGHWTFFLHPSKGKTNLVTGWVVKARGKEEYHYHLDGHIILDPEMKAEYHTESFTTWAVTPDQSYGDFILKDMVRGKALQKKIQKTHKVFSPEEANKYFETQKVVSP